MDIPHEKKSGRNAVDYYGTPDNNALHLMNRYFTAYPSDAGKVVLTVKTGLLNRMTMEMDCSAAGLRKSLDNALAILDGKKKIDIFGISRVDPNMPVEESVRALDEFRREGKIGGIQLSEVRADTIRRAAAVAKIDMVEAEASLFSTYIFTNGVASTCADLDITLVAHTPLGMGMLGGQLKTLDDIPQGSILRMLPRYQPDTFPINVRLVQAVEELARGKGCSTAQVALSWLRAKSREDGMPFIVPTPGARSEGRVWENAADVGLGQREMGVVEGILDEFPVVGGRTLEVVQGMNEY